MQQKGKNERQKFLRMNFLQAYTSDRRYEQIRRDLQKRSTKEGEVKMCTVMDLQKRKMCIRDRVETAQMVISLAEN